jgi:hypothetical protein
MHLKSKSLNSKAFSWETMLMRQAATNTTAPITISNLWISIISYQSKTKIYHILCSILQTTNLEIGGIVEAPWPLLTISKASMVSFLEFVLHTESYSIAIGSISGESWLLDAYHTGYRNVYNSGRDSYFTIALIEEDSHYVSHVEFSLSISKGKGSTGSYVKVAYDLNDDHTARDLSLKHNLTHLHSSIENLIMNWGAHRIEVGSYIDTLLINAQNLNLKRIEIIGGLFNRYSKSPGESKRGKLITHLSSTELEMDGYALLQLSPDFPTLKCLTLNNCVFRNVSASGQFLGNDILICMGYTDIDLLRIRGNNITRSMILFSIFKKEQNSKKYYMDVGSRSDPF